MKRFCIVLTLLCITLLTIKAQVIYTPETLPKVHLQNEYRHLCNPDGIISLSAQDSIDSMLHRLREQTGIEVVIAELEKVLPTMDSSYYSLLTNAAYKWLPAMD